MDSENKKKLVKIIEIYVYSDGSTKIIEKKPEPDDGEIDATMNQMEEIFANKLTSRRIQVNTAVYVLFKKYNRDGNVKAVKKAIDDVTDYLKVAKSTVLDKLYRQLDITSEIYTYMLYGAIDSEQGLENYRNMLLNNVSVTSKNADKEMIDKYIV